MKNYYSTKPEGANNRKVRNKYYAKILLVIVFLVAIVSGVSYAFYTLTVDGNKKVEMTAGTFNIEFEDGNAANVSNGIPMTDNEGLADNDNITTFSITNTGDIAASYSIALEEVDIDSNTMDKKWIKYSLREKDGDWSTPQSLSNGLLLRNNLYLESGVTVNYELKIWLAYEAPNDIQGKKFSAKVVVNAIQSNAKLSNTTQPIINIANTSINVIKGDTLYRDPIPYEVVDANKNKIDLGKVEKTYEYFDGETVREVNSVDVNNTGIYYIYYRVTDADGNKGCTVVSINVCEENNGSVPIITLNGPDTVEINKGSKYVDDGAFATDDEDGELKVITIGEVNTNVVGEYIIKYIAKDSKGNLVSVIKTVRVVDGDKKDDDDDEFTIKVGTIAINSEDANKIDIPVTVKSTDDNKVKVILSENSDKPSVDDFNDSEETSNFDKTFNVTSDGTYYIWVLDSKNNMKSKKVIVNVKEEEKPDSKPVCRFSGDKYMTIDKDADNNTIDLICTDEYQEIKEKYLNNNDFQIGDSNIVEISEISGYAKVDNGYKYTITLNSLKAGDTTLTLKDGVISNIKDKSNDSVSTNVYVRVLEIDDEYKNLKMNSGDTKEIVVKNSVGDLEYVSSDEEVATVSENGVINTGKVGTATITVTDALTKSKVEINVNVVKKVTVEYVKNGKNVDSIEELNTENTTCELNSEHPDSCEVTLPEFTTTNGYKTVGWSTSATDHSGTKIGEKFSVSENTTLYTISNKEGKTYEISWNSNGVIFSDGGTTSCSVDDVYNDEEYEEGYTDSCFVKKPKIDAEENVTIVGYNTDKEAHEAITNVDDDLELNSSNNKEVYYVISYKNPITYTANFIKNGYAVSRVGEVENNTCTIEKAWNNETQQTSCEVATPEVEVLDGYSFVGWNTSNSATTAVNNGNMVTISEDTDFYTITKFDEKAISARFSRQGLGVSEISSNIQQCVIPEKYNPMEKVENVCILDKTKIPTITIAQNDLDKYEVIGWNEDPTATTKSEAYTEEGDLRITGDTTYYTITKRKATTLTAIWDANGAELEGNDDKYSATAEEKKSECIIPEVYNETEENKQDSTCSVVAPTIIRDGFTIDGYVESGKEDLEPSFSSNDTIVLTNDKSKDTNAIETGKTWKAKTHKTINVIWHTNGAKLKQGDSESENDITTECTIMNSDTSCSITSPEIIRSEYNIIGYNTSANDTESIWASKEMKSVSENQEYYAITSKDVTAEFYYNNNDNDKVNVITDTQTLWNNDEYQYNVPEAVTKSIGPRDLEYSDVTTKLNSTDIVLPSDIKTNIKYYAVYSGDVDTNFYYYNLHEGGDINNASQEVETVYTNISAVIKESTDSTYTVNNEEVDIPSVVSDSEGPGGGVDASAVRKLFGLSKDSSSKVKEENITTENENYYAIYKGIWKVTYSYDEKSIKEPSALTSSCDVYGLTNGSVYSENADEGSCVIKLPSVTLKDGYNTPIWYDGDTAVGSPNEEYTITGFKTLNAKATINTYIVSYDCNTNGGVCHVSGQDEVEYNGLADLGGFGEKEGYDFVGWNTDKDATTGLTEAPRVTDNMTLYAIFRKTTSVSLSSKTSVYTGSKIDANEATVADGNNSDIDYTYYTDNECSTKVSVESGATDTGKAPIDAGVYYVKATTTATNGNKVSSNCVPHTITPKEIIVTWDDKEYTYNGKKQVPTYTTTGAINGETISYAQSEANDKNQIDANGVGENYTAKLSIKSVSGGREKASNYQLVNDTKNYVINPGVGYVNLDSESGTAIFGDNNKSFVVTGTHGGELSAVEIENEVGQKSGVSISINSNTDTNKSETTPSNDSIINLNCDKSTAVVGDNITCTISANISSGKLSSFQGLVSLSSNLELVSSSFSSSFSQDFSSAANGNYKLSTASLLSGNIDIGSFVVNVKTANDNSKITLGNIKIGDENYQENGYESQTVNIPANANLTGITINISNLKDLSAGTEIKIKVTSLATDNYTSGSKIYTLTIDKANSTCPSISSYSDKYDGNEHSITVSGGSGGKIQYSTDGTNWSDEKPTRTLVGETIVYVRVYGNSNYNSSSCGTSKITISKGENRVKVQAVSGLIYGSTANMVTTTDAIGDVYYKVDSELTSDNYTSGSTTIPTAANKDAKDKYKVYYYALGNENYKATSGFAEVKISKENSVNPKLTAYSGKYDTNAHSITVSGGSGGTIMYSTDNKNWTTTKPTYTNVTNGAKTIYVKVVGDKNHNDTAAISSTVTITKATPTVNVSAVSNLEYGSTANMVNASASSGVDIYYKVGTKLTDTNFKEGSTIKPTATNRNPGTYIVYYYANGGSNYESKSGSVHVNISKKDNDISVTPNSLKYQTEHDLVTTSNAQGTVYYSVGTPLNSDNYSSEGSTTIPTTCKSGSNSYSYSDCEFRNAGDYLVYYYATGDATHKAKSGSTKVTIAKLANTLSVSAKSGLMQGESSNMVTVSGVQGSVYYKVDKVIDENNYTEGSTTIPNTCTKNAYNEETCLDGGSHTIYYYTPGNTNYAAKKGNISVSIGKHTGNIKLSSSYGSVSYGTDTKSFTVSSHHGGKLSASANNSAVSVSVSGNTVKVSNLSAVPQRTTIKVTVTSGETGQYYPASASFNLTINQFSRTATFTYDTDSGIKGVDFSNNTCETEGTSYTCSVKSPKVTTYKGYSFSYWSYGRGYTSTSETGYKELTGDTTFTAFGKDTEGPEISYNSSGSTSGTKYTKTSYTLYYNLRVTDNSNNYNSSPLKKADVHIGGLFLGSYEIHTNCGGGICNYTVAVPISSSNTYTGAVSIMIPSGTFKDTSGNVSSSLSFNPGTTFKEKSGYSSY